VSTPAPVELDQPRAEDLPEEKAALDQPWVTIVWNDPVNLMSYVTYVFQNYFGYPRKKAEKLMLEVHQDGKSVVSTGSREEMERDVQAMHEYGLWATMQKADAP
jgi:ATP-dependent Clp protease adaptor protein ClpS